MSQGAIFKLVLRDERFDRFFTASDYLRTRLDAIRQKRAAAGNKNVQPTFTDIEKSHILYVHAAYRPYVAVATEYARVKPFGDGTASIGPSGGTIEFTWPVYGHFTSDLVLHVRFRAIGSQAAFEAGSQPTPTQPLLRYCAYPGLRMIRRAAFTSDKILIDDYTTDEAVSFTKFFVDTDHVTGWKRCHGQQEPRLASYLGNGYTGYLTYSDGPQTPKLYHDSLDMFIPLQFWLSNDASHALLNDLIPNTQRSITCELAPLSEIVKALIPDPNNPGALMQTALPFSKLNMDVSLYVGSLYTNPEIHDIFATRIGFSLIRVHRRQVNGIQTPTDAVLLDQLKFPAEFFTVGFRERAMASDFDRWWLNGIIPPRTNANKLLTPAMIWNYQANTCQLVCREATETEALANPIDMLGVTAHGVEIYPMTPALFYNGYLPIKYQKSTLTVSPNDTSTFMVTFCLYPGQFNPSGYYNLSAGRELYLNYAFKTWYNLAPGAIEMVVAMSALNFLMRKGDKVSLRYAL